jgi:hypothetical protein
MSTCQFKNWKTIELGTGIKDPSEFRAAINAFGHIDDWANRILDSPGFQVAKTAVAVDLVNVSVADLGFINGARLSAIYKKALDLGLELCPNETGPQLRLQYKDQPMDEWIRVAMEPIVDSDGSPGVLSVGCNRAYSEKWWLRGGSGSPDYGLGASNRLVFVLPRELRTDALSRTMKADSAPVDSPPASAPSRTMNADSAPAEIPRASGTENAKETISKMHQGLIILEALNEVSPNVPANEASLFSGSMSMIVSLVGLYPRQNEQGRKEACYGLHCAQSICAEHVKKYWKQAESFRALSVERLRPFPDRSPDIEVFATAAKEVLVALLACLHATCERGSVPRSSYELAIPCLQWLAQDPDSVVSAQARDILGKMKGTAPAAPPAASGGCFVATAAYGAQDCNVVLLQEYRDRVMIGSLLGRCAVRVYYFLSPPLARFIGASSRRRSLARRFLGPFIVVARRGLEHSQFRKG